MPRQEAVSYTHLEQQTAQLLVHVRRTLAVQIRQEHKLRLLHENRFYLAVDDVKRLAGIEQIGQILKRRTGRQHSAQLIPTLALHLSLINI